MASQRLQVVIDVQRVNSCGQHFPENVKFRLRFGYQVDPSDHASSRAASSSGKMNPCGPSLHRYRPWGSSAFA
jgi:hypothetical protein